jgi:hypothetical protein
MPHVKAIGTHAHTHTRTHAHTHTRTHAHTHTRTHAHTGGAGVVASCVMLWSEYTLKTTVMLDRTRVFSL